VARPARHHLVRARHPSDAVAPRLGNPPRAGAVRRHARLLVALLAATASTRIGGRFRDSSGWTRFAGAVHMGLVRFRPAPIASLSVLLVGFAYQFGRRARGVDDRARACISVGWAAVLASCRGRHRAGAARLHRWPRVREAGVRRLSPPARACRRGKRRLGLAVYGMNLVASLLGRPAFAFGRSTGTSRRVTQVEAKSTAATPPTPRRLTRQSGRGGSTGGAKRCTSSRSMRSTASCGTRKARRRSRRDTRWTTPPDHSSRAGAGRLYHERWVQRAFLSYNHFIEFWTSSTARSIRDHRCGVLLLFPPVPQRYDLWRNTLACTTALAFSASPSIR